MMPFRHGDQELMRISKWEVGESNLKCTPYLRVTFVNEKGDGCWVLWLTENNLPGVRKFMVDCGLNPDSTNLECLDPIHPEAVNLLDKEFVCTFREETYKGRTQLKIAFANRPPKTGQEVRQDLARLNESLRRAVTAPDPTKDESEPPD